MSEETGKAPENLVRAFRLAKGNMSQEDLAREAGVSPRTIHSAEKREHDPQYKVKGKIARVLLELPKGHRVTLDDIRRVFPRTESPVDIKRRQRERRKQKTRANKPL